MHATLALLALPVGGRSCVRGRTWPDIDGVVKTDGAGQVMVCCQVLASNHRDRWQRPRSAGLETGPRVAEYHARGAAKPMAMRCQEVALPVVIGFARPKDLAIWIGRGYRSYCFSLPWPDPERGFVDRSLREVTGTFLDRMSCHASAERARAMNSNW